MKKLLLILIVILCSCSVQKGFYRQQENKMTIRMTKSEFKKAKGVEKFAPRKKIFHKK